MGQVIGLAYLGILGLIFGSFTNVLIARVPAGQSINGRSACPKCGHQIRWYDNVPLLSWLVLHGRCRDCAAPIAVRYPLVEALGGAGLVLLGIGHGLDRVLPLLCVTYLVTLALAFIDLDTMLLPNVFTYPLALFSVGYLAFLWGAGDGALAKQGLIAAGLYTGFFLLLYILTGGRGLGFGDVKLAPSLGAVIGVTAGISAVPVGLGASFILGGLPAAVLMVLGKLKRKTAIPFGPLLILGAWIAVLAGHAIVSTYLQVTGLSARFTI